MEWVTSIIVVAGFVYLLVIICNLRWSKEDEDLPEIVCINANCGYKGNPCCERQRSDLILLFLFFCGIWPAIVYYLAVPKYKYTCPQCEMKLMI